jgi:hypothetical protein
MSTATEALEQFFAAINRNDMQAITKDFDPEIVRIEPDGFATAGTYRSVAEVQENVEYLTFWERADAMKWAGIED